VKLQVEGVLQNLGMIPTEVIRIFCRQIYLRGGMPFPVEIPNECTAETLKKSQKGEGVVEFESSNKMMFNKVGAIYRRAAGN